jgi:hypothetical protein
MEDDRGSTPRSASARGRAGEPAAQPTRATGRPPAAIFMEPAIPVPREAEPDTAGRSEPEASAEPTAGRESPPAPIPTTAPPAKAALARAAPAKAAPAKTAPAKAAEPAKPPADPAKATPTPTGAPAKAAADPAKTAPAKAAPAKAVPTNAVEPVEAAEPAKATAPPKARTAKTAPPAKTTPPAKATPPAKIATPAKTSTPAKAIKAPAPVRAAAARTTARKAAETTASKAAKTTQATASTTAATAATAAKASAPPEGDPPATQFEARIPEPPASDAATDPRPVPSLWDRVRAEPRQVPELLARAAVERYGPEADRYTRWIRATYPAASDDRIAQAAARRFTAQARRAALAAVVGHGAGEAAALGWVQARMVLHIAAAYRADPAAPERAAELLTLMGSARVPVGAGVRAAGRGLATRLVPGAGLLLGALLNDADTGSLARRAISLYRPVPRLP